ncbi:MULTISPECIES: RNA polymerase sigma factor [Sphingobacterium]|jgi:RNA polymerase sigma factor (sigma-70 family)|uniref:Sigma-70 family RNA polymerase sigma factor n=1 Tax=Sphingobacterium litopenaei TaxID=2763500 RepID=A0ABR7YD74_9SPHI|nr:MULTISPECIES: sigma-70 family RNA polymerase sigma factor [Sphingobacterium]MBD1429256.1 sigma-70 family RNA polymerase sigma factor [Sphingobacterium litopenaei]NGM72656.1 sigma-70 family RNA polymerase sigma factor [Sphingobacterium sp. SGL-16]
MHLDQIYIQYLKDNNSTGIQLIYNKFSKQIVTLIQQNNGSEDDGYDIFQESLVDIYHMAHQKDFQLTTSFSSFLKLVCKRKWLNALKKNQRMPVTNLEQSVLYVEDESNKAWDEMLETVNRENIVMSLLDTLGESCQQIIKRCMQEKHQEKIAESMGITYAYLRKKKSECMATLVRKVKESGLF